MNPRMSWQQLPAHVRRAIEERVGPVTAVIHASAGQNSALAATLHTANGPIFVKGLRTDHHGAVTQAREAAINEYVQPLAPRLRWQAEVDVWNLLCFDHVSGRHADYQPSSPDVGLVVDTMRVLAELPCPDLPTMKRAEQRWSTYVDDDTDPNAFRGSTLLHTDYNPDNILVDDGRARLIDWAWPTIGAAFIDPGCLVVRLIMAGHSAREAEDQVKKLPAWEDAPKEHLDAFSRALAAMWDEIATSEPMPWKRAAAKAARHWVEHRVPGTSDHATVKR